MCQQYQIKVLLSKFQKYFLIEYVIISLKTLHETKDEVRFNQKLYYEFEKNLILQDRHEKNYVHTRNFIYRKQAKIVTARQ